MLNKVIPLLIFILASIITSAQTIIFSEDFADNRRKWDEDTTDSEMCYIKNGRYYIKTFDDNMWHWFSLSAMPEENKNWLLEATIYLDKIEDDNGFYGVLWGAADAENMCQSLWHPKQHASYGQFNNEGKEYKLFDWQTNDSINAAKTKFSVLKIDKKLYCLINGHPIGKAGGYTPFGNKLGFIAALKTEISVDDISVKIIDVNSPVIAQITTKFSPTEENLVYYNDKGFTWDGDLQSIDKKNAEIYRIFTVDDDNNVIGYVKEYDAKTDKLINKFQAKKISSFWKGNDILDGDFFDYDDGGNLEFKAVYFNPNNMEDKDFMKSPTMNLYKCDNKEHIIAFKEIKDGKVMREIEFDDNGVIEKASNSSDVYNYEKNNFGDYDKIIEENFNPPLLDWPEGEISSSASKYTSKGYYVKAKEGDAGRTSKIPIDFNNSDFSVGLFVDIKNVGTAAVLLGTDKLGMNYTCFAISNDGQFAIFNMYNGVRMPIAEWTQSNNIRKGINALDIIKMGKTIYFSINGTKVKSADYFPLANKTIGLNVNGVGNEVYFSDMVIREIGAGLPEEFSKFLSKANEGGFRASGTGFFISNNGYIVTNNHVIEDAKEIYVEVTENETTKTYRATLVNADPKNDLATIKINKITAAIPYSLNTGLVDVGSKIFTLGYPYALTYLGKEIKFTEGSISSKTGYANDINTYQVSVPVQSGNSGGPLFDDRGNLVGVINAKFTKGDNVAYAIKSPVLKTFLDLNSSIPKLPTLQSKIDIPTVTLIKKVEKFVVLIKIK